MKIAVIGLGSIGLRHARNLIDLGHHVIGHDPDPRRRELLPGSASERAEALDGVTAAVIASPNASHLEDIEATLVRNLHVFVEKPPAHSADALRPLVEQSTRESRVFFTGVNLRVSPLVRAAHASITSGEIGDVLWARFLGASWLPDWRPESDHTKGYAADPKTGGVLFDYFHEFDLAVHLLGRATAIAASARCTGIVSIASEDVADVLLRHEGGVQSAIHVDYVTRVPVRVAEICGTRALLRVDIRGRTMDLTPVGEPTRHTQFDGTVASDYIDEMRTFVSCIETGDEPPCPAPEALAVLELVVHIRRMCGLPA